MDNITKGEWRVVEGNIYCDIDKDKARLIAKIGGTDEQAEANANLVAAAPDMYEALRLACVCMSFQYASDGDIGEGARDAEKNYGGGAGYAYRKLREALAKARSK